MAIAYYYTFTLDKPARSEWLGKHGVIYAIMKHFNIQNKKRKQMKLVLEEIENCIKKIRYTKDILIVNGGEDRSSSPDRKKMRSSRTGWNKVSVSDGRP